MTFFHSIYAVYARCSTILYTLQYYVLSRGGPESGDGRARALSAQRAVVSVQSSFIVVLRRHLQLIDERDQHIAYASAHRLRAVKILAA